MGNVMSHLYGGRKKMLTPRTLEELAASVELVEGNTVEESVQASVWGSSFLQKLKYEEMEQLFMFLVLCVELDTGGPDKRLAVLREIKERVFSDSHSWIPSISFRDTDGAVEEIFQIYDRLPLEEEEEEEDVRVGLHTQAQRKADQIHLINRLLSLRYDRTVRTELEPIFREWVKRPSVSVQQCLLSLL